MHARNVKLSDFGISAANSNNTEGFLKLSEWLKGKKDISITFPKGIYYIGQQKNSPKTVVENIQNIFEEKDKNWYVLLLPPFIGYICIPFFHALWEKVYYKFYENGNDFLYLPTLQEINTQEVITSQNTTNSDITVDLS